MSHTFYCGKTNNVPIITFHQPPLVYILWHYATVATEVSPRNYEIYEQFFIIIIIKKGRQYKAERE